MENKHTEGKWQVSGEKNNIIITAQFLNGTDPYRMPIAYMQTEGNCPDAKAKAEFIVRACNSHDELVEACKAIVRDFEDEEDPLIVPASSCVHVPHHTDLCPYWLAKQAIAKATG